MRGGPRPAPDRRDAGPLADEHTRFRVGSLSKVMTALGVLHLVQEGHLALSDCVRDFLLGLEVQSEFRAVDPIRIEHLLTHSSGLPSEVRAEHTFEGAWSLDELIPLIGQHPLLFPPGARSQYSNVGYNLLGLVIERVSGSSFEAFMAEHVFAPLGMRSAGYRLDARTIPGYYRGTDGVLVTAPRSQENELPAGGLIASAHDLVAFLTRLLDREDDSVLSQATRRLLLTPGPYRPLAGLRQQTGVPAMGFFVERRFGMNLAYHSGSRPGYLAFCHVLPDCGSACFTLIAVPLAPSFELWKSYLKGLHSLVGADRLHAHGADSDDAAFFGHAEDTYLDELPRHRPTPDELAACAGRYGVLGYYDVRFEVRADTLWTDYGRIAELVPIAPHVFVAARYLTGERVRFVFRPGTAHAVGVYVSMTYHERLEDPTILERHASLRRARFGTDPTA
jgi:hypothetical protein